MNSRLGFMVAVGATTLLALSACSPAAEPVAVAEAEPEISSTTAPAQGGPVALPTDEGVTPAPAAIADATAEQAAAPASPAAAAAAAGGKDD